MKNIIVIINKQDININPLINPSIQAFLLVVFPFLKDNIKNSAILNKKDNRFVI